MINKRRAFIFGIKSLQLSQNEIDFLKKYKPWGVILFLRNIKSIQQAKSLTDNIRKIFKDKNYPILIDQEGGRVQRIKPPIAKDRLPPLDEAIKAGQNAENVFRRRFISIANELRSLGIDSNCAPILDIARPNTHKFLRNRCYGINKSDVILLGKIVYGALKSGGVLPIIKHIPGHGLSMDDSHLGLPVVKAEKNELYDNDFAVFKAFANAEIAMSAHVLYETIDPKFPASTSKKVMRIIREDIKFSGLLISDDISMSALSGSLKKRTKYCDICRVDFPTMYRVQYKAAKEWVFVCEDSLIRVKKNNTNYKDGGTWKK